MSGETPGLVSVIIPTWNRADLIRDAIDSVLRQTYKNLEILICDDGSTDTTRQVVGSIDDDRIRFIDGEHSGRPAVPRNRGIGACRGEWIAFLDSDDAWRGDKLEKQLQQARQSQLRAVCSNATRYIPGCGESGDFIYWNRPRITFNNLLAGNLIINSSAMFHASLVDKVLGFPEDPRMKAIEDYSLWLRVLTQTDFAFVSEPLVTYRDEPITSVRKKQINIFEAKKKVLDNFSDWSKGRAVDRRFLRARRWWFLCQLQNLPAVAVNAYLKLSR